MEINIEDELKQCVREGIREGVKKQFSDNYHSPLGKLLQASVDANTLAFREMLDEAIKSTVNDVSFRSEILTAIRSVMAKVLVQRFGGEMEKQVNALKSDPTTRARIVLAIEEIVKSNS